MILFRFLCFPFSFRRWLWFVVVVNVVIVVNVAVVVLVLYSLFRVSPRTSHPSLIEARCCCLAARVVAVAARRGYCYVRLRCKGLHQFRDWRLLYPSLGDSLYGCPLL